MGKKCTRCRKTLALSKFRTRHDNGRPMPWCEDCKRQYDAEAIAAKRAISRSTKDTDHG